MRVLTYSQFQALATQLAGDMARRLGRNVAVEDTALHRAGWQTGLEYCKRWAFRVAAPSQPGSTSTPGYAIFQPTNGLKVSVYAACLPTGHPKPTPGLGKRVPLRMHGAGPADRWPRILSPDDQQYKEALDFLVAACHRFP